MRVIRDKKRVLRVLLIEDDPDQAELIIEEVRKVPARIDWDQDVVETEYELLERRTKVLAAGYDACVIDGMIQWTHNRPDAPPRPDEVREEGLAGAGIRCARSLRDGGFRSPILLYTVLRDEEVKWGDRPPQVEYAEKTDSIEPLVEWLRAVGRGEARRR
ncbi:MAG: hypothetical protein Q8P41_23330 [Pseudomonadota bacterium]|nr:hypothetical protein [Pseudomonadota bacterium]